MVVEVIAGIALMKQGVTAIKDLIHTAEDVNDITHHLTDIIRGHEDVQKKFHHAKSKPLTKWQLYFKQTIGRNTEDEAHDSLAAIAAEVMEKRQAEKVLQQVERAVNRRFPGAWDEVQELYKQRKEEAKQAEIKAKQMAKLKAEQEKEFWDHVLHWILESLKLILVIGGAILMFYLIWINRCTSGTC
tara:strand:+ start:410 stop:970 length:561 start_codon:yes stop_codon:yes gene_type:complete